MRYLGRARHDFQVRSATVCIVSFLNSPTYIGMPVWVALITPVAFVLIGLWTMRKKAAPRDLQHERRLDARPDPVGRRRREHW